MFSNRAPSDNYARQSADVQCDDYNAITRNTRGDKRPSVTTTATITADTLDETLPFLSGVIRRILQRSRSSRTTVLGDWLRERLGLAPGLMATQNSNDTTEPAGFVDEAWGYMKTVPVVGDAARTAYGMILKKPKLGKKLKKIIPCNSKDDPPNSNPGDITRFTFPPNIQRPPHASAWQQTQHNAVNAANRQPATTYQDDNCQQPRAFYQDRYGNWSTGDPQHYENDGQPNDTSGDKQYFGSIAAAPDRRLSLEPDAWNGSTVNSYTRRPSKTGHFTIRYSGPPARRANRDLNRQRADTDRPANVSAKWGNELSRTGFSTSRPLGVDHGVEVPGRIERQQQTAQSVRTNPAPPPIFSKSSHTNPVLDKVIQSDLYQSRTSGRADEPDFEPVPEREPVLKQGSGDKDTGFKRQTNVRFSSPLPKNSESPIDIKFPSPQPKSDHLPSNNSSSPLTRELTQSSSSTKKLSSALPPLPESPSPSDHETRDRASADSSKEHVNETGAK